MIKIFFVTFFIAELIIAITVILKIYNLNKEVNRLNDFILTNQNKVKTFFVDTSLLIEDFRITVLEVKSLISRKRQEYLAKIIKTILIYTSFFFLKGKYKRTILAYQIAREIFEGLQEA